MSKIILNLAISLDGFIADNVGGYDWIVPAGDQSLNTKVIWSHDEFLKHVSIVVMGKRCFDEKMHLEYNKKEVYIITSKKLDDYDNIHFINEDICSKILELKNKVDGDIYLFGGGLTIDPLLKAGLIDEYIIGIIPIILGNGRPLFLDNNPQIPLYLTHNYVEDGIVVLRYVSRISKENY